MKSTYRSAKCSIVQPIDAARDGCARTNASPFEMQRLQNVSILARCVAALIIYAAIGVSILPASATDLPALALPVGYQVVDQDVGDVVTGLAAQVGLRADVSAHVHGHVHGRMSATSAGQTLTQLGALYGFDWYCDGQTIYVSGYGEAARKVMPLGQVSGDELLHAIDTLGVADQRWPVRMSAARDIVFVNGPPHYVALVEQTLAALAERAHAGVTEVHVFRGGASGS